MSKHSWKHIDGIGLGIVAFEGTEHLASIITEFRDIVDYVVIGLQRKSYHGDPIDKADLNEIFRLKDEDHLVDHILEVELDTTKEPRIQETDKRNLIIQDIENHGCSHAIVIDSDEYYTHKSLLRAIQEIDDNDYEITYCQYVNYYADYNHFLVYPFKDGMYVPFVTKTKYRHTFECYDTVNGHKFQFPDFALPSDPTRRYVRPFDKINILQLANGQTYTDANGEKLTWMPQKHYLVEYHVFPWETVKMHHLSWLRADMRKKVNNWSSKTCFQGYNDLIDKAIDVYNHFDHKSKEQQMASLLFNTPNHEVFVRAFPKQYIHPKYDYQTRLQPVRNEKRIAIMNMSTTNSQIHLYEKLEQCGQNTWAKDVIDGKYPNIDYWTVIDCHEDSHIDLDKHIIYIKTDYTKDNIQQLLQRWLSAYELVSKYKTYDYVLRTNISTWVNVEFINEMLAYETDDSKIFSHCFQTAFWSSFNIYPQGAMMVWPTRNIQILRDIVNSTSQEILDRQYDDVMIGILWKYRADKIGLSNYIDCYTSLDGNCLREEYDKINWENVEILPSMQIKTRSFDENLSKDENYRLNNDIPKMERYDKYYRNWRSSLSDEEFAKYVKDYMKHNINKFINVLYMTRNEWIYGKWKDKEMSQHNYMPYNQKTLDWLKNKAIECGYRKKED